MTRVDYIITGGGCAGLSLVYHLINSGLRNKSVLIIDKEEKKHNDKTWCFWTDEPTVFDAIIFRKWHHIEIVDDAHKLVRPLDKFVYNMIRAKDFYDEVYRKISEHKNVRYVSGVVQEIREGGDQVYVTVNDQVYASEYVFDSCFSQDDLFTDISGNHFLMQHFKGWFIETKKHTFDPQKITMFDFRVEQKKELRFMYILPLSDSRALIEYTIFSDNLLQESSYDEALAHYIAEVLKIQDYRIIETEKGIIPMTDHKFRKQVGHRIMNIGTKGGACKPSTGYAFLRIQQESKNIVHALLTHNTPFISQKSLVRYQIYDSMLLNIMQKKQDDVHQIFMKLFENNPIERVFCFLNENASLLQDVKIMSSVPPFPFLRAIRNILSSKVAGK